MDDVFHFYLTGHPGRTSNKNGTGIERVPSRRRDHIDFKPWEKDPVRTYHLSCVNRVESRRPCTSDQCPGSDQERPTCVGGVKVVTQNAYKRGDINDTGLMF